MFGEDVSGPQLEPAPPRFLTPPPYFPLLPRSVRDVYTLLYGVRRLCSSFFISAVWRGSQDQEDLAY